MISILIGSRHLWRDGSVPSTLIHVCCRFFFTSFIEHYIYAKLKEFIPGIESVSILLYLYASKFCLKKCTFHSICTSPLVYISLMRGFCSLVCVCREFFSANFLCASGIREMTVEYGIFRRFFYKLTSSRRYFSCLHHQFWF